MINKILKTFCISDRGVMNRLAPQLPVRTEFGAVSRIKDSIIDSIARGNEPHFLVKP